MCLALEKAWVQFSARKYSILRDFSVTFFSPLKRKEINGYNALKHSYKMTFLYIMGLGIP
jgi:hypothetical protein